MRTIRASLLTRVGAAAAIAAIGGTGVMAAAPASAAAVHHRRMPTMLTIRNRYIAFHHHHADLITGVLRSHRRPLPGETVYLESRTGGRRFAVVASQVTGAHGQVSFPVAPKVRTQYELLFKGDAAYRPSRSVVVTLRPVRRK